MRKFRVFLETETRAECEECSAWFDLARGGGCMRCRRMLCARHLHGSFARRLLADLGAESVCVRCRGGAPPRVTVTPQRD